MHFYAHLDTAARLLEKYNGTIPFAAFLKNYFRENKKHGSRDRKNITALCYSYFRLGKALPGMELRERILTGYFLSATEPDDLLKTLKPEWALFANAEVGKKLQQVPIDISSRDIFPWQEELSSDIDPVAFSRSFLIRPDVFIRVRPGNDDFVQMKFRRENIWFKKEEENCLRLNPNVAVEKVIELDREAVIQDYNSQKTMSLLSSAVRADEPLRVWDCCAGSGGKSILLKDSYIDVELTVSDIRTLILENLEKRFQKAGIENYQTALADLTREKSKFPANSFDVVICDAPCTGSGTWSRTPEQLFYFNPEKIHTYSTLQKKIVSNALLAMKQKGYLLYITCSVFKEENEEVVSFIERETSARLISQKFYHGYDKKADTLFAALLQLF